MIIHLCHMIYCIFHDFTTKMSPIGLISILSHITGIWTTSTKAEQTIPTPQGYGWNKELGSWVPVWSTIPEVSRACRELIKCSCKGDCSTCKCGKANLDCSPLCKCNCRGLILFGLTSCCCLSLYTWLNDFILFMFLFYLLHKTEQTG